MEQETLFELLADAVLYLHFLFAVFVVAGFILLVAGICFRWRWTARRSLRIAHAGAVAVVVGQAWLGLTCPLTTLENWLRSQAGQSGYTGSFLRYWVHRLLFFDLEPWMFTLIYTLFGVLVFFFLWLTWRRA